MGITKSNGLNCFLRRGSLSEKFLKVVPNLRIQAIPVFSALGGKKSQYRVLSEIGGVSIQKIISYFVIMALR